MGDGAGLRLRLTPPSNGALALRVYLRAAPLPPSGVEFLEVAQVLAGGNLGIYMGLKVEDAAGHISHMNIEEENFSSCPGCYSHDSNASLPPAWTCVEWDVLLGPSVYHHNVFLDGGIILDSDLDASVDDFNTANIGLVHAFGPADLYFDDVVIATFGPGVLPDGGLPDGPLIGCE
jgi:hypothetical protein